MSADEKTFTVLGRNWTARFDFNSICELEERYDRPFLELVGPMLSGVSEEDKNDPAKVAAAAMRIKFTDLRAVFHQAVLSNHPEATVSDAGAMIADMGLEAAMEIVGWAVVKAMPNKAADEGKAKAKR